MKRDGGVVIIPNFIYQNIYIFLRITHFLPGKIIFGMMSICPFDGSSVRVNVH